MRASPFRYPPFFVLGNPRSGTTMLRLMLSTHPRIVVPPECGFIIWLQHNYGDWSWGQPVGKFLEDLSACKKFNTWGVGADEVELAVKELEPVNYSELMSCVFLAYCRKFMPSAHRWGDKNNFHVRRVDELVGLFPSASFIHIVRDVRDVACSYRDMAKHQGASPFAPKLPADIRSIAKDWLDNTRAVEKSFASVDPLKKLTVRYEDVAAEPEVLLISICDFLGEPFSPEMLEFHKKKLEPVELLPWKQRTLEPTGTDRVRRYERDLDQSEQRLIADLCGDQLKSFGYL